MKANSNHQMNLTDITQNLYRILTEKLCLVKFKNYYVKNLEISA